MTGTLAEYDVVRRAFTFDAPGQGNERLRVQPSRRRTFLKSFYASSYSGVGAEKRSCGTKPGSLWEDRMSKCRPSGRARFSPIRCSRNSSHKPIRVPEAVRALFNRKMGTKQP